jgi:hypothetical protein
MLFKITSRNVALFTDFGATGLIMVGDASTVPANLSQERGAAMAFVGPRHRHGRTVLCAFVAIVICGLAFVTPSGAVEDCNHFSLHYAFHRTEGKYTAWILLVQNEGQLCDVSGYPLPAALLDMHGKHIPGTEDRVGEMNPRGPRPVIRMLHHSSVYFTLRFTHECSGHTFLFYGFRTVHLDRKTFLDVLVLGKDVPRRICDGSAVVSRVREHPEPVF